MAHSTLPSLPAGKTDADMETTIHSHVTGTIIQNNTVYSHNAAQMSPTDGPTFMRTQVNIIAGPLKQAVGQMKNGKIELNSRSNGIVLFGVGKNGPLSLTKNAVKKILPNL